MIPDSISDLAAIWFAYSRLGLLATKSIPPERGAPQILIVGAGPMGQMAARWAQAITGSKPAILSRHESQLSAACRDVACFVLHGATQDWPSARIFGALEQRPTVVIDCTSDPSVLAWSANVLADAGHIILVGDPAYPSLRVLPSDIMLKGLTLAGVHDRNTFRLPNDQASSFLFEKLIAGSICFEGLKIKQILAADARAAFLLLQAAGEMGIAIAW